MGKKFEGKVALVTGAGSGIGRATALAFADSGAKVVVGDIVVAGGEETVGLIRAAGGEASFVKVDVSKTAEVEALIAKTVELYGRLDCAVNNAGVEDALLPLADSTEENFDRLVRINLKGVWLGMKYEIQQMLQQGGGAIVNTSSAASLIGLPGWSTYAATKAGVNGMTRTAAAEYARAGVRVNAVAPGGVKTALVDRVMEKAFASMPEPPTEAPPDPHPMGRSSEPEEIAHAILWLCSDEASFVTGAVLPVDGGLTMV